MPTVAKELARAGWSENDLARHRKTHPAKLGVSDAKLLWMSKWPTQSAAHPLRMPIMGAIRAGDPAVEGLGITKAFLDEHQRKKSATPTVAA